MPVKITVIEKEEEEMDWVELTELDKLVASGEIKIKPKEEDSTATKVKKMFRYWADISKEEAEFRTRYFLGELENIWTNYVFADCKSDYEEEDMWYYDSKKTDCPNLYWK